MQCSVPGKKKKKLLLITFYCWSFKKVDGKIKYSIFKLLFSFFLYSVKQECVVVLVIIFFMTPSPQSQRIGEKMEVTLLLIHVIMQICALHTEAVFQMGYLVLNHKVTGFFIMISTGFFGTPQMGLLLLAWPC